MILSVLLGVLESDRDTLCDADRDSPPEKVSVGVRGERLPVSNCDEDFDTESV